MKTRFLKYFKFAPAAVAVLFAIAVLSGGMTRFERWQEKHSLSYGGAGGLHSLQLEGEAYAQAIPSQPAAPVPNNFPNGARNGCSGLFPQPSAGIGATQAGCLANFHNVGCMVQSSTTPGGLSVSCFQTAVGTVTQIGTAATATFTAGGIQVNFSTANGNATVVWFGIN